MIYPSGQSNPQLFLKSVKSMQVSSTEGEGSSTEGSTTELTLVTLPSLGGSGTQLGLPPGVSS